MQSLLHIPIRLVYKFQNQTRPQQAFTLTKSHNTHAHIQTCIQQLTVTSTEVSVTLTMVNVL